MSSRIEPESDRIRTRFESESNLCKGLRRIIQGFQSSVAAFLPRKMKRRSAVFRGRNAVAACKDSIPIRFRFESGSNPVGFRFDSTTQFLPNSYPIPTQFPPFILGQIVWTSRFGQINLSWGEYICKRTRELLLCHSNQDGLPMDKKIVYSSRFVRVILAQGPC